MTSTESVRDRAEHSLAETNDTQEEKDLESELTNSEVNNSDSTSTENKTFFFESRNVQDLEEIQTLNTPDEREDQTRFYTADNNSNLYGIQIDTEESRTGYSSSTRAEVDQDSYLTSPQIIEVEGDEIDIGRFKEERLEGIFKNFEYLPFHDKNAKRYAWEV